MSFKVPTRRKPVFRPKTGQSIEEIIVRRKLEESVESGDNTSNTLILPQLSSNHTQPSNKDVKGTIDHDNDMNLPHSQPQSVKKAVHSIVPQPKRVVNEVSIKSLGHQGNNHENVVKDHDTHLLLEYMKEYCRKLEKKVEVCGLFTVIMCSS